CSFDPAQTQPVGLLESGLQFLLHIECDLKCNWTDRVDQQGPDGLVDATSRNMLAHGLSMFDSFALAHIIGTQALMAHVIPDGHALTARVGCRNQHLPLLLRNRHNSVMTVNRSADVVPPKHEGSGIAWIVQDPQHLT